MGEIVGANLPDRRFCASHRWWTREYLTRSLSAGFIPHEDGNGRRYRCPVHRSGQARRPVAASDRKTSLLAWLSVSAAEASRLPSAENTRRLMARTWSLQHGDGRTGPKVPEPDDPDLVAAGERPAVGAHGQGPHVSLVAVQRGDLTTPRVSRGHARRSHAGRPRPGLIPGRARYLEHVRSARSRSRHWPGEAAPREDAG